MTAWYAVESHPFLHYVQVVGEGAHCRIEWPAILSPGIFNSRRRMGNRVVNREERYSPEVSEMVIVDASLRRKGCDGEVEWHGKLIIRLWKSLERWTVRRDIRLEMIISELFWKVRKIIFFFFSCIGIENKILNSIVL